MHFVILQVLYSQGIISGHMTSMVPMVTNRHNAAFTMATAGTTHHLVCPLLYTEL